MKSILVISPWLGKIDRGAETFARELSVKLASKWDVTLVTGGKVNLTAPNLKIIECTEFVPAFWYGWLSSLYFFISRNSRNSYLSLPFKLIAFLWNFIYLIHPEVIYQRLFMNYLNTVIDTNKRWDIVFPQNGLMGMRWASRLRNKNYTKVAYTGHGGIGRGEYLIIRNNPDAYIAISETAANWAIKFSKNVHFIQNGVMINKFSSCLHTVRDHVTVLTVGALTSFKRHELTIKAVSLIPEARLIIVGVGELRVQLEAMCESLIPGRYKILSVPYEEIASVYAQASVFVLPSVNEPMGIVYLEALSAGLPIVAPDDDLRHELLKDHAEYVDVTDTEKYSEKIKLALAVIDMNSDGYDYVTKNFSWDAVSEKYDNIFRSI
jgi:glycosyltransferase involved in cell wall biosynthesis